VLRRHISESETSEYAGKSYGMVKSFWLKLKDIQKLDIYTLWVHINQ